jgi:hypothetical protein
VGRPDWVQGHSQPQFFALTWPNGPAECAEEQQFQKGLWVDQERTDLSGYTQADLDKVALRLKSTPEKDVGV